MNPDYDVVIVGAGAAGLAAAICLADKGLSVSIVEKGKVAGGSARLSGGVVYAGGTSVQAASGIQDSIDDMYTYYMAINQNNLEPGIVRRFCEESGPTIEWLLSLGATFQNYPVFIAGIDDVPRGHRVDGSGEKLVETLLSAAHQRGVEIHLGIRVESLLMDKGRVAGIRAQGGEMRSAAVLLASGGYGANRDMLSRFNPDLADEDQRWTFYFGTETNEGDGLRMGEDVGGRVIGEGRMLVKPTPGFSRNLADFHPSWLVMVNIEGRRFMKEDSRYCVSGALIRAQPEQRCFVIIDEAARESADSRWPAAEAHGAEYVYSPDRIAKEAAQGRIIKAETLEGLARLTGIDGDVLSVSMDRYNQDVQEGHDRQFLKTGVLKPVSTGPFYAVELRAGAYGATSAGLWVNADTQVLSKQGKPIPGLFAAGEVAGGVVGDRYVGSGNFVGAALTFGRVAAQTIRQEISETKNSVHT